MNLRLKAAALASVLILCGCSTAATPSGVPSAAASAPSSAAPSAGAETLLERIKRTHTLQAFAFSFAPAIYADPKSGDYKGYVIDILNGLAKKLDVDLNLVFMTSAGFVPALQSGRIDVVEELYKTPEREKVVDFSNVYMYYAEEFYVNANNPTVTAATVAALTGKKIAVVRGTAEALYAAKIPNVTLVQVDNAEQTFLEVTNGRADAALQPAVFGDYGIAQNPTWKVKDLGPMPQELQTVPGTPQYQPAYFAVAKDPGDASFLAIVNEYFDQIRSDGTLKTILATYGMGDSYITGQP
jgi:polar amino acid transport system substrate-binding protein